MAGEIYIILASLPPRLGGRRTIRRFRTSALADAEDRPEEGDDGGEASQEALAGFPTGGRRRWPPSRGLGWGVRAVTQGHT